MSQAASRKRFTIERLRTLVLIGGLLLVVAIVAVLFAGKWARRLVQKDIPGRLGIDIVQQADGVDYSQTRKGKTLFKIHASRAVKKKSDGSAVLKDVRIELFAEDGSHTDTISGSEFDYNPNEGIAKAAGEVEITMMRPGVRPAIAQMPMPGLKQKQPDKPSGQAQNPSTQTPSSSKSSTTNPELRGMPEAISDGQIHVKTSGLIFHQKEGLAETSQRVDFALGEASGSANGATYNSQHGSLVLDHDVSLHANRGHGQTPAAVNVVASHAEFLHEAMTCRLVTATAKYNGETVQTGDALIHFRDDGSVARVDGSSGVDLQGEKGSRITAPTAVLNFDAANHPTSGLLQGGTRFASEQPDRHVEGSAPSARLTFDALGDLSQAHLETGVVFQSRQQGLNAAGKPTVTTRNWHSQTADIRFASVAPEKPGRVRPVNTTKAEPDPGSHTTLDTIHGVGGVVLTSETTSGGVTAPSRLSAEQLTAEFGPDGNISKLNADGHTSFEERTLKGDHQTGSSDQLEIHFQPSKSSAAQPAHGTSKAEPAEAAEIESLVQTGHVVLTQEPAAASGGPASAKPALHATADRADYDGTSQVVRLSGSPRVHDGGMDLSADHIDFHRATGDALARGVVRANWISARNAGGNIPGGSLLAGNGESSSSDEPVHAVAAEAELRQSTQEVIFRSQADGAKGTLPDARLWQAGNSIAAPVITLNRQKQTLTAEAAGPSQPVRTVLVGAFANAASLSPGPKHDASSGAKRKTGKSDGQPGPEQQSVIRLRSGNLHYSEAEHLAIFRQGELPAVVAETTGPGGAATISAQQAEVKLLPGGADHAPPSTGSKGSGSSQHSIDRLTASGQVVVNWPERRGTGAKLVFLGDEGTFTLTGAPDAPPRITDEARGSVTGNALIYHSRDASVTVEGDGGKTITETRSKK